MLLKKDLGLFGGESPTTHDLMYLKSKQRIVGHWIAFG